MSLRQVMKIMALSQIRFCKEILGDSLGKVYNSATIFAILAMLFSSAHAQETDETLQESVAKINNEETPSEPATPKEEDYKESSLLKEARGGLANTLLGKDKPKSLMFDDQEYENLQDAIESLKNNQIYVPDGSDANEILTEEGRKKSEAEEKLRKAKELENQENEKSYIYLASIIYFNPKDWIIWINDKKITSKTNDPKKELYVETISKGKVSILWKLSLSKWKIISGKKEEFAPKTNDENQIEIQFELKPNQTFILSSSKIVEGKALINLQKKKEEPDTAISLKP
jgi:hypothetical protein